MTEMVGTLIFAALVIIVPIALTVIQHIVEEKRGQS